LLVDLDMSGEGVGLQLLVQATRFLVVPGQRYPVARSSASRFLAQRGRFILKPGHGVPEFMLHLCLLSKAVSTVHISTVALELP
jgi:hypothetical protein